MMKAASNLKLDELSGGQLWAETQWPSVTSTGGGYNSLGGAKIGYSMFSGHPAGDAFVAAPPAHFDTS